MAASREKEIAAAMERIRAGLERARRASAPPEPPDAAGILRRRARDLAQEVETREDQDHLDIIEFRLGRDRLAFEAAWVAEAFFARDLLPVPGTPPYVAGVLNRRGTILAVLDLRQVLAIAAAGGEHQRSILLLAEAETEFGVLADGVVGAREVCRRDLGQAPAPFPEKARRYLRGILPGPVALLDAGLLLQTPALRVDQGDQPAPGE